MKKKLYTIQHESEDALQALQASPISLSTEKKNTSSIITAHSIVQYGYYQTIAQKVLADFNIKENLPTNQIENIKEKDLLVKAFIAGNTRILQKYDSISISNVLYQDYTVIFYSFYEI